MEEKKKAKKKSVKKKAVVKQPKDLYELGVGWAKKYRHKLHATVRGRCCKCEKKKSGSILMVSYAQVTKRNYICTECLSAIMAGILGYE